MYSFDFSQTGPIVFFADYSISWNFCSWNFFQDGIFIPAAINNDKRAAGIFLKAEQIVDRY